MDRTVVLTQGSIPRQLIWLALPLICGNILQQLYNTVDAFIIGRFLGGAAFGAVGVAGTVMNLFIFILSGCCTGVAVLFAQFYGAGGPGSAGAPAGADPDPGGTAAPGDGIFECDLSGTAGDLPL